MIYSSLAERIEREFWVDSNGIIRKGYILFPNDNINEMSPYDRCSIHSDIAQYYFPQSLYGKDTAFRMNWIICNRLGYDECYCFKEPSQSQLNTMFDLGYECVKNNTEYYNFIKQ